MNREDVVSNPAEALRTKRQENSNTTAESRQISEQRAKLRQSSEGRAHDAQVLAELLQKRAQQDGAALLEGKSPSHDPDVDRKIELARARLRDAERLDMASAAADNVLRERGEKLAVVISEQMRVLSELTLNVHDQELANELAASLPEAEAVVRRQARIAARIQIRNALAMKLGRPPVGMLRTEGVAMAMWPDPAPAGAGKPKSWDLGPLVSAATAEILEQIG